MFSVTETFESVLRGFPPYCVLDGAGCVDTGKTAIAMSSTPVRIEGEELGFWLTHIAPTCYMMVSWSFVICSCWCLEASYCLSTTPTSATIWSRNSRTLLKSLRLHRHGSRSWLTMYSHHYLVHNSINSSFIPSLPLRPYSKTPIIQKFLRDISLSFLTSCHGLAT